MFRGLNSINPMFYGNLELVTGNVIDGKFGARKRVSIFIKLKNYESKTQCFET
jgi:hypothetical protein